MINTGRQEYRTAARRGSINSVLNRFRVVAFAVPFGAELAHVEKGVLRRLGLGRADGRPHGETCPPKGDFRDEPPAAGNW